MNDAERLEQIRKKGYADAKDDIAFLLKAVSQRDEQIRELERKVKLLVQQNQELTAAMEDVRADFERRNER